MQIVIPMSGVGNRFIEAGHTVPKFAIEIDGSPIIEHVINLFPGEKNFVFICNEEHLASTNIQEVLLALAPEGKVISIPRHKLGPVHTVLMALDSINTEEEVIVSYCDYGTYWDYADFLRHTRERNADGAVVSYKGFHPHMLGSTNYAFMRHHEQWMLEIKEKEPFTSDRMKEFASNGTYYFKTGAMVRKYFTSLIERKIHLKDEYYVSLVYNLMKEDDLRISIYEIQHMLQWGTPQDVTEYNRWSSFFRSLTSVQLNPISTLPAMKVLVPMAGRGSRFTSEGYTTPKPLIEISGKPMAIQASKMICQGENYSFICLEEHLKHTDLKEQLEKHFPSAKVIPLDEVTNGQASTCEFGIRDDGDITSLLITACDNGVIFDQDDYLKLIHDDSVEAICWTFRNHPSAKANPQMYGWVKVDGENNIVDVSVKKPISDHPENDHAIVGTFFFRSISLFKEGLKELYTKNVRVNNEFYVDSLIGELMQAGKKVKAFEVKDYVCWGTPNDYKTFCYWQSFFHKCHWHPYNFQTDGMMAKDAIERLELQSKKFAQEWR